MEGGGRARGRSTPNALDASRAAPRAPPLPARPPARPPRPPARPPRQGALRACAPPAMGAHHPARGRCDLELKGVQQAGGEHGAREMGASRRARDTARERRAL